MMNQEQQLEQLSAAVENYKTSKAPPIFELFAAMVSMSISILLFVLVGVFQQENTFYELMLLILPQTGWAIVYFAAGMLATIGLLIDSSIVRIIALVVLVAIYGTTAAFYIATFPNLAGVLMFWITVFSAVSIPMVKHTGIRK